MGDTNGTISYQSIYVNSGITANVISATTISANTFYGGSLSSSFIGNGDVNDQEFKYISGITSDTQTQINEKVAANTNFLTYTESQSSIQNSKKLEGVNVFLNQTQNEIEVSLPFNQTLFKQYSMSVSAELSFTSITNFNLSNLFNDSNRAVQIVITQGNAVISGISGGTDGNILMITNIGAGLVILENESTKCTPNSSIKFKFSFGSAFFLTHRKTIFLIYNSSEQCWKNINFGTSNSQYDYINEFNDLFDFSGQNGQFIQFNGLIPNVGSQSYLSTTNSINETLNNVYRTTFLDSNHVLNINLPANPTVIATPLYFALVKPNRADYYLGNNSTNSMINIYKFSLTSTTFSNSYCFLFGMSNISNAARTNVNGGGSILGLRTPTPTDTNPTYLQSGLFTHGNNTLSLTSSQPTDLNLVDCLNSWCYAGFYNAKIGSSNNMCIFTSSNGNEYLISRIVTSNGYIMPSAMLRSISPNTNTNSIFLDTYYQIDSGDY